MLLEVKLMALAAASSLLLGAPASAPTFDHSRFDELLKKHVVKGMVDYAEFEQSGAFKEYLESLEHADVSRLGDRERLAFWINAYNAYTIALIDKYEERASIKNIAEGIGFERAKGPWKQPIVKAGGKTYTLDEVEHEIIRKQFREPRIHFALVCAAVSCPLLRSEAYTGAKLDAQLESQARTFVRDETRGSWVDVKDGILHASRIFDWYKDDFGGSESAVGRYIAQYYPASPEKQLLLEGHFKTEFLDYDWTLNSRYLARLRG
jgi:Protein of unknown function, DUF547